MRANLIIRAQARRLVLAAHAARPRCLRGRLQEDRPASDNSSHSPDCLRTACSVTSGSGSGSGGSALERLSSSDSHRLDRLRLSSSDSQRLASQRSRPRG